MADRQTHRVVHGTIHMDDVKRKFRLLNLLNAHILNI